ncbi:MAG: molybdate ABC transporter substrate-binding protein [Thaumarchaeota archaeon]|nr:molybdate ABC transporter substrate-binding protein [Nitrososphaerota archaeon]
MTPSNEIVPLRVFAAASFGSALQSIQSGYQLNNSVSLIYNFASSGSLETQIAQGSPDDVFLSADAANNQKLQTASLLANNDTYQTLIYNYIQVYVAANNPKNITDLASLLNPGVRIAIGAPASVPAGAYTLQVWNNVQSKWGNSSSPDFKSATYANYTKNMMTHVVSQNTDVETAITQVLTGATDAAFGYVSDGVANAAQLHAIVIPSDVNVQAVYTVSAIKTTAHLTQANAFIGYLLSPQGQAFLKKWGFTPLASASIVPIPSLNLTLTGAKGTSLVLHASDISALQSSTGNGGLKTKAGVISNVGTYVGVPIMTLINMVGVISTGQSVNVTGSDGYTIHYTYAQVTGQGYNTYSSTGTPVNATQPLILLVAYGFNGAPLGTSASGGTGPLRTVLVGPQGLLTDGNLWVKWVVSIQVLNSP